MTDLLTFTVIGVVTGAVYAIAASGLVVTYTTSGVFNFAHGAVGMVLAFTYWQVSVDAGLPIWLALPLVLGVIAPLSGVLLERVLFRRLSDAPVGQTLVVTVGLLVLMLGLAQTGWDNRARTLPEFLPGHEVRLLGIVVTAHQLIIVAVGAAVAGALRLLLFRSRIGVAMRAVVDNRELAAENGALPERVAALAWAIGATLAGVAGILLAPALTLDQIGLTLLVVNGYAAAILGQLRSLPLTYAGAMILGIAQQFILGYATRFQVGKGVLGNGPLFNELYPVLPVLFLFGVLVFLPQARLRVGRVVGGVTPRVPDLTTTIRNGGLFVAVATVAAFALGDTTLANATAGLCLAMIMLSLVLLSGYGGQIALCQLSFVGVGAMVMGKLFPDGQLLGLVVAALVCAGVGALVSLPALRLQDLYLALVTFAVGLFFDEIVFDHPKAWNSNGSTFFPTMKLGPIDLSADGAKLVVTAIGFSAFAVLVLAIRRGPFGRRLAAMSDSPAAAATLGMNGVATKMSVFALSAAMAGSAGGLFAITRGSAGALDFGVVKSLIFFLLATIGGITTVTGAFIGGVVYQLLPTVQERVAFLRDVKLDGLFIGVGAIVVSRTRSGFAGLLYERVRAARQSPTTVAADPGSLEPVEPAVAEVAL